MGKPRDALAGLFLLGMVFVLCGWTESFQSIRSAAGGIKTLQADFVQEKHMPILARPLTATGRFMYKAPGALRWEYTAPVKSLLLMRNGEGHRYRETEQGFAEDTAAAKYMDFVMEEISKWLSGRFDETAMFTAALSGNKIVLSPRDEAGASFIKRIEMVMGSQPGVMETVTIFESEDSFTRISFLHPRINEPIADEVFKALP